MAVLEVARAWIHPTERVRTKRTNVLGVSRFPVRNGPRLAERWLSVIVRPAPDPVRRSVDRAGGEGGIDGVSNGRRRDGVVGDDGGDLRER